MGGSDCYCAICACPFYDILSGQDVDEGYDLSVFADPQSTVWLQDLRCIGLNPQALGKTKCFISGPGTDDGLGSVNADPGDDPNFPSTSPYPSGEFLFPAYHVYVEGEPCFPFHPACYHILTQVLYYESCGKATEFDKDLLYHIFLTLNTLEYGHALGINYFELEEFKMEQYFYGQRGQEPWVMHPLELPDLRAFCKSLPKGPAVASTPFLLGSNIGNDKFSRLPGEILVLIMSQLRLSDVTSFRLASRSAASISLTNVIWRAMMLCEMPWLNDILPQLGNDVDNKNLYKSMKQASMGLPPSFIRGIANRRRIWNISQQIVKPYLQRLQKSEALLQNVPEDIQLNSKSLSMPVVGYKPNAANYLKLETWIATSMHEVEMGAATVEICWSRSCELAGITVLVGDDVRTLGSRDIPNGTTDLFVLDANDWITGFIVNLSKLDFSTYPNTVDQRCSITGLSIILRRSLPVTYGQQSGNKRKIACRNGNVVFGLLAQTADEVITRLGIREYGIGETLALGAFSPAEELLWSDSLPPTSLTLGPRRSGQWQGGYHEDLQPYEVLLFGESINDLATIVSFAVSSQLDYFEVNYGDGRPSKSMGRMNERGLKRFLIDGAAGERIVYIGINATALVDGLRIITNFNRQCIFGGSTAEDSFVANPDNETIYGLYGKLVYRGCPTTLGLLTGKTVAHAERDYMGLKAGERSYWEPTCPPAELIAFGPIYGKQEIPNVQFYPSQPMLQSATWIDFSRPIQKISGLLGMATAKDRPGILQLQKPLVFRYEDGLEVTIASPLGDISNMDQEPVAIENSDRGDHAWFPYQGRVSKITVWSDEQLRGLQFHDEVGDSPVWGNCSDVPATELLIDSGGHEEEKLTGLKITFCHFPPRLGSVQGMRFA